MANGTNIPSGSSPLYFGSFSPNSSAMAQRMTNQMMSQAEKENTRQSKERSEMLKALSFDAVQGLGRKAQEEHLGKLTELQDKWSNRWLQSGKKFTDKDYLELERDKATMAQEVANMRHNVALYARTVNDIQQNPDLYHWSTLPNLVKYQKEGNVGKDVNSLIQYMPDTDKYLYDTFGNLRTTKESKIRSATDIERGIDTYTYSNRDEIDRKVREGLKNNEYHQSLINSGDPYVRARAEQSVENFVNSIASSRDVETPFTSTRKKEIQFQQMSPKYKRIAEKYDFADMSEGEIANAAYFNDFAIRVLEHDKDALDLLLSKNKNKFSDYNVRKDGSIEFLDKDGNVADVIPPIDRNDPDIARQAMTKALDFVPYTMNGKQKPSNIQNIIRPEWEETVVKNKADVSSLAALKKMLSKKGNEREDYGPTAREGMIPYIEDLMPDVKVESKFGTGGKRKISVDGEEFDLSTEKERKRLIDYVSGNTQPKEQAAAEEEPATEPETNYTIEIGAKDSIAERHNNPGNLIFANQPGAKKGEPKEGGGYWAEFESPEAGFEALQRQIELDKSREMTLGEFINKYAPATENDTTNYISMAEEKLGVKKDVNLGDIDTFELAKVIAQIESSSKVELKNKSNTPKLSQGSLDDL